MRCGAFVDTSRIKQYTEDDFILPETPPFNWLLRKTKEEIPEINKTDDEKLTSSENEENLTPTNLTINNLLNANNNLTCKGSDSKLSQSPKTDVSGPSSLKSVSRWSLKGDSNEEDKFLKELVSFIEKEFVQCMFTNDKMYALFLEISICNKYTNW